MQRHNQKTGTVRLNEAMRSRMHGNVIPLGQQPRCHVQGRNQKSLTHRAHLRPSMTPCFTEAVDLVRGKLCHWQLSHRPLDPWQQYHMQRHDKNAGAQWAHTHPCTTPCLKEAVDATRRSLGHWPRSHRQRRKGLNPLGAACMYEITHDMNSKDVKTATRSMPTQMHQ